MYFACNQTHPTSLDNLSTSVLAGLHLLLGKSIYILGIIIIIIYLC